MANGKDMPGESLGDDLKRCPPYEGYGANAADIERGYLVTPYEDSDERSGNIPLPIGRGFLYRGFLPLDR